MPLPRPAPQCDFTKEDTVCVLDAGHFGAHEMAIKEAR